MKLLRKLVASVFILTIPVCYYGLYTAPGYTWEHMISMDSTQAMIHMLGEFGYYWTVFAFYGVLVVPLGYAWFAYLVWPKAKQTSVV